MADRQNLENARTIYEHEKKMLESRHPGSLVIYDTGNGDRVIARDYRTLMELCRILRWTDENGAIEGVIFPIPQPSYASRPARSLAECVWFHDHKKPHKLELPKPAKPAKPARAKRNRRPRS